MNTIMLIAFLFLILVGAGTGVGIVVAQNITANESANMNSSTLQLSGNLTNTSSTVISNTT
jgi:Na+-driven multidrug efflux pump